MRILWIGKASGSGRAPGSGQSSGSGQAPGSGQASGSGQALGSGQAGDEVYDREIVAALRHAGASVDRIAPERVSRAGAIAGLLAGVPHQRNWYASRRNVRRLRAAAEDADLVFCSWEPLDRLAAVIRRPVIPILHNITSRALPALYPGRPDARLLAWRAARWERQAYRSRHFPGIAVLARQDAEFVAGLPGAPPIFYAPPGMPRPVPLSDTATFRPEIVLSGTYDWAPKHRDILAFARDYARLPSVWPVHADALPGGAAALLGPRPFAAKDSGAGMRIGIIPDRFQAGHKLKTTFYLAHNALVLSYADVSADFAGLPDASFFIRRVWTASEIAGAMTELSAMEPAGLRARFEGFKAACAARFSWARSAATLLEAGREFAMKPNGQGCNTRPEINL